MKYLTDLQKYRFALDNWKREGENSVLTLQNQGLKLVTARSQRSHPALALA
jgi:hypothetical protein